MRHLAWLLWLALVACQPEQGDDSAVVQEMQGVRAAVEQLNLQLMDLAQQRGSGPARPAAAGELKEALDPLRQVVEQILTEQAASRQSQTTLTAELNRWTALLGSALPQSRETEIQGLQQRLEKLEADLKAQDARHREIQDLLLRAMDSTAGRLEQFLKAVGGGDLEEGAPEEPGTPVPAGKEPEDPAENRGGAGMARASSAPPGLSRALADPLTPWLLAVGVGLLGMFAWRVLSTRRPVIDDETEEPPGLAADGTPGSVVETLAAWHSYLQAHGPTADTAEAGRPGGDQFSATYVDPVASAQDPEAEWGPLPDIELEEIGEVAEPSLDLGIPEPAPADSVPVESAPEVLVDAGATPVPGATESEPDAVVGTDEPVVDAAAVVATDDGMSAEAADPWALVEEHLAHAVAPSPPAKVGAAAGPPVIRLTGACVDPASGCAELLELLAGEPRVLRRPAPRATPQAEAVTAEFWVLPHLPEGERAQLRCRALDLLAAVPPGEPS